MSDLLIIIGIIGLFGLCAAVSYKSVQTPKKEADDIQRKGLKEIKDKPEPATMPVQEKSIDELIFDAIMLDIKNFEPYWTKKEREGDTKTDWNFAMNGRKSYTVTLDIHSYPATSEDDGGRYYYAYVEGIKGSLPSWYAEDLEKAFDNIGLAERQRIARESYLKEQQDKINALKKIFPHI